MDEGDNLRARDQNYMPGRGLGILSTTAPPVGPSRHSAGVRGQGKRRYLRQHHSLDYLDNLDFIQIFLQINLDFF